MERLWGRGWGRWIWRGENRDRVLNVRGRVVGKMLKKRLKIVGFELVLCRSGFPIDVDTCI